MLSGLSLRLVEPMDGDCQDEGEKAKDQTHKVLQPWPIMATYGHPFGSFGLFVGALWQVHFATGNHCFTAI